MTVKLAFVAPLLSLIAIVAVAAIFLSSNPHAGAGSAPDIGFMGIDTNITGNVATPCQNTGANGQTPDYPCNTSTVLSGGIQTCLALTSAAGANHTGQIDVVGQSIPLGGSDPTDNFASGMGAGQSDGAIDWTPNSGNTGSYFAITAKDFSVALVHQGADDFAQSPTDSVGVNASGESGHWKWTDADVNADGVGEGGEGIAVRLTLTGIAPGLTYLTLTDHLLPIGPSWTDVNNNEYTVGTLGGAWVAVDTACPATGSTPTPSPTPVPTPSPTPSPTPAPATLTVSKAYVPAGPTQTVTATPHCTNGGTSSPLSHSVDPTHSFQFTITGFTTGATCSVTETGSPAGYAQTGCQTQAISNGTDTPCTITNTTSRGFNVTKVFSDGNTGTVTITLTCDSPAIVTPATANATGGGAAANFTVSGFAPGATTCSATESSPGAGYVQGTDNCTTVTITLGTTALSCTIHNDGVSVLRVSKTYSDNTLTPVTVTPTCSSGAVSANPSTATPGGADAVFTISGFAAGATCTIAESNGPAGYAEDPTNGADTCHLGVTLVANSSPSCNIVNSPSTTTFTVQKDYVPENDNGVSRVHLTCTGSGVISGGNVQGDPTSSDISGDIAQINVGFADFTVTAFSSGDTCTATEVSTETGYSQTATTCNTVLLVNKSTETCKITNQTTAEIDVSKNWEDNSVSNVTVDGSCGSGTFVDASQSVPPSPAHTAFFLQGFVQTGTRCHMTENPVPPGYNATYFGCDPAVFAGGDPYTCIVTNNVNTTTFEVDKIYSPALQSPPPVDVSISCTNSTGIRTITPDPGTTPSQPVSPGSPAFWTITYYDPGTDTCTATEAVPQGYTPDDLCTNIGLNNPINALLAGAPVSGPNCTITNTLNQTTWEVDKNYPQNLGPDVSIDITCPDENIAIVGGFTQTVPANGSLTLAISHFTPGDTCSVDENPTPTGYVKSQSHCADDDLLVSSPPLKCVITNTTQATFEVDKVFSPSSDASVSVTLSCPAGGPPNGTIETNPMDTPAVFTVTGFTGNPTCTATESPVQGYAGSGDPPGTCAAPLLEPTTLSLAFGTCTITNTLRDATFTVAKVYLGSDSTDPVDVTVTCPTTDRPNLTVTPSGPTSVPPGTPTTFTVQGFNVGDQCTATESPVPAGYSASYDQCVNQTVTDGGNVDCTITNTLNTATFTVYKEYTNPLKTDPVTVHITCTSPGGGVPDDPDGSAAPGSPFQTTIRGFNTGATCTAYEDVPAGFSESDNCGSVLMTVNGELSCTITNADTVHFLVYKQFNIPTATSVTIYLTCSSGNIDTVDPIANGADPARFTITEFQAGTTCTAHEVVPQNWISNETDCQNVNIIQRAQCTILDTYTPGAPSSSPPPPTSRPRSTPSPSPSSSPVPSSGPTARATRTPGAGSVTPTPTPSPTPSPTASPTPSPSPSPSTSASPSPSTSASPSPTPSPTPVEGEPTPTATPRVTRTPIPSGGPFSLSRISRLAQFW